MKAHVGRVGVAVAEPRFARLATADGTTSLNARAMMTPPCSPLNNRQSGNRGNAATAAKQWWRSGMAVIISPGEDHVPSRIYSLALANTTSFF